MAKKEETEETISVHMYDDESKDQLTKERGKCLRTNCEVRKYFLELRECTARVHRKIKYTAENCHQETVDLIMALDRCVKDIAFSKMV